MDSDFINRTPWQGYMSLSSHQPFQIYKNGRDAGHTTNRARLTSTEDGARSVWWEGFTGATGSGDSQRWKYDAGGEIVTRNGASYYKEWVTGGKTGRELSYARHQCKSWTGADPFTDAGPST
jgi:hypothetical protein